MRVQYGYFYRKLSSFSKSRWGYMRDRFDPRTQTFLKTERKIALTLEQQLSPLADAMLQEESAMMNKLSEAQERPEEDDLIQIGHFGYFFRYGEQGEVYGIYRTKGLDEADETVAELDQLAKEIAKENDHVELGELKVSEDSNLVALTVRIGAASEHFTAVVKDMKSGKILTHDKLRNVHTLTWFSVPGWSGQSSLFFTELDAKSRPYKVWRCCVSGSNLSMPELVFEEKDDRFALDVSTTKDDAFLLINSNSKTTSEVHVLNRNGSLQCLSPRQPGLQYFAEHMGSHFWLVSNKDTSSGDYRVFKLSDDNPVGDSTKWEPASESSERDDFNVEELDVSKNRVISFERSTTDGAQFIRIGDHFGNQLAHVNLLEMGLFCDPASTPATHDLLHLSAYSPCTPSSLLHLDASDPENLDLSRLTSLPKLEEISVQRIRVNDIPVTLAFRAGTKLDTYNPLLINVYGAYGTNLQPHFEPSVALLLSLGWVVAFAHVRGGQELGRAWHEQGKLLQKKNSIQDLIAVTEGLHNQGWSRPALTAGRTWSAGALALGGLINERPDLYRAAILRAPFLNVLDTMRDPSLPLTSVEYDEWGDPNNQQVLDYIRSYDPFENLSAVKSRLPSMLISCSLADLRVPFWVPCAYVAKVRSLPENVRPKNMILRWSEEQSHFGMGHEIDYGWERAIENAFLFHEISTAASADT